MPKPVGLSAPRPTTGPKPLILPRRVSPLQRAQEASQASAEARRSIGAIISQSRTPWSGESKLSSSQVEELNKTIRQLEAKVAEREMLLAEAEGKLADRERELAEAEALLQARANVLAAAEKTPAAGTASREQLEAMQKLKEQLDRQEKTVQEQRQALKEREEFIEASEAALFEKMQSQQEKETELEQKEEDIRRLMRQSGLLKDEPKEPMEKA